MPSRCPHPVQVFIGTILCGLANALDCSTAQGQAAVSSFQLSPGIVVDSERGEAYVMSPEGEIVAVDLSNGVALWRSQEAAKPLTLTGNLLVGQSERPGPGNALSIVTLDTAQQGARVAQSLVSLPPNVHPMIGQRANRSFTAEASPQPGEATVSWEFVEQPLRGVPPGPLQVLPGEAPPAVSAGAPPGATAPAARTAPQVVEPGGEPTVVRGSAQIDLASGTVTPVTAPHLAATPMARTSAAASASEPAPGVALPGVPQPQFLSADGRHVLSSKRVADDPEWDKYLWTIFERESGNRVGEFRTHVRYVPFFVKDSRVVYQLPPHARQNGTELVEEPVQLRAVELTTGATLWKQPVRDTVDRRPRPP